MHCRRVDAEAWRYGALEMGCRRVACKRYGVPESRRCAAGVAAWACGDMDV